MATLHIRSFPENLYQQLNRLAEKERRSLSQEVVVLLERVMETPAVAQAGVLSTLDRLRFRPGKKKIPSTLEILREERDA